VSSLHGRADQQLLNMSRTSFYTTLPSARSIRLLRVGPGTNSEIVFCSLEIVEDLQDSAPLYYALSYCWGDEEKRVEVVCDGEALPITKNLHYALIRLRREYHPVLLWADAICIDQYNVSERNQQVSFMDWIYRCAYRVYIWIGPSDQHTGKTISIIREIARRIHNNSNSGLKLSSWMSVLSDASHKGEKISTAYPIKATAIAKADWEYFWKFYQAPWFFRVWVIQEVRQTADVRLLCGDFEIEWNFVGLSAMWVWLGATQDSSMDWKHDCFPSFSGFKNASLMWDKLFSTRRDAPFLALLHSARPFKSTDPRDKIFALLHHNVYLYEHGKMIEEPKIPDLSESVSLCR
jgi:hypothetical protein